MGFHVWTQTPVLVEVGCSNLEPFHVEALLDS